MVSAYTDHLNTVNVKLHDPEWCNMTWVDESVMAIYIFYDNSTLMLLFPNRITIISAAIDQHIVPPGE